MIDKSQQEVSLRVCLDDVGTHNKAVLDFFFAKLGKGTFDCVPTQEEANVLIIDYDFPPARQRYENEYQEWQKPSIIISISEVMLDNAIWLSKPLTSNSLLDAAASAKLLLNNPDAKPIKKSITTEDNIASLKSLNVITSKTPLQRPEIKTATKEASTIASLVTSAVDNNAMESKEENNPNVSDDVISTKEQIEDKSKENTSDFSEQSHAALEARWKILCGEQADFDASSNISDIQVKESFFLNHVKDAIKLARESQQGVVLSFSNESLYFLPEINRVFSIVSINEQEFIEFIDTCNSSDNGNSHVLSEEEIHALNELISQHSHSLYDMESFLWSSTLLSSQASLPENLDPNEIVGLKHWPNMTRIESFPHLMPIAAQWSVKAMSAFDVAKTLNIPQRYVFSFYNAANNLGLIEMNSEKLVKKQSKPRMAEPPRGLFSRLIKRLAGE